MVRKPLELVQLIGHELLEQLEHSGCWPSRGAAQPLLSRDELGHREVAALDESGGVDKVGLGAGREEVRGLQAINRAAVDEARRFLLAKIVDLYVELQERVE